MYYHVVCHVGSNPHYWQNLDYDELIRTIVIPYINKQVIPASHSNGTVIMNLSTANYLRIFKTGQALTRDEVDIGDQIVTPGFEDNDCTQEIIDQFLLANTPKESKSLLQYLFMPIKSQVFVIMKFKDKAMDSAYEGVIKPIAKKFKYNPLRIDEVQDSGRISDQILGEIASSAVILADLTGERPNCYYEAGFAHAIGKEIIFTIHKGYPIHFDLAGHRFIEWETEDELRKQLQKRFRAIRQRVTDLRV